MMTAYTALSIASRGKNKKVISHMSNFDKNFHGGVEILHADAAILKNVKCDISAAVQPILMKFGKRMHISPPNVMGNQTFSHKA